MVGLSGKEAWRKYVLWVCLAAFFVFPVGCKNKLKANSPANNRRKIIGEYGSSHGLFVEPRAIATAQDGSFFVIDRTSRVQRFSRDGQFELLWEMPDAGEVRGAPSGICVDRWDRVFVADTHQHRVIAFDFNGKELFRFGSRGMGPGQFMLPTDVAVDADGFIYVSEYGGNDRISKFDSGHKYVFSFGDIQSGSAALQRPSGIAIDIEGNVWVADTGNHRICVFDSSGGLSDSFGEVGGRGGQLRYPRDVVFLVKSLLAVVDSGNDRILLFTQEGDFVSNLDLSEEYIGRLNRPVNAAVSDEVILIADSKGHRIVPRRLDSIIANENDTVAVSGVTCRNGKGG